MDPKSLGSRLLSALQLNLFVQAAILAVNLVATPIIVGHLGADGYALYTLMFTMMNYLSLLNLGTSQAATTFTAQRGLGEGSPVPALIRRSALLQLGAAAAGGLALYVSREYLTRLFIQDSPQALFAAPRVFACVAVAAPLYFLSTLGNSVLYGLQRFSAFNLFLFFQSVLVAIGAALLAHFRLGGLREIALCFVAAHALLAAGVFAPLRKALSISSEPPSRIDTKAFVRFSLQAQLTTLAVLLISQGDRFFVASLLPLAQVGYYAVSSSLAQKFNQFCVAVAAMAFPLFAELHGSGQQERLRRFYLKTMELMLFINLPLSILSFVLIPQFMTLWLGQDFSLASTWPFRVLLFANLGYLVSFMPMQLATSKGHPHLFAVFQAVKAALVLLLWTALIADWGILGAAAGLFIGEMIVTPVFVGYIHRRLLGVSWKEFWTQACYRPATAAVGLAAIGLATHGRVGSWGEMIAFAAAGLAAYFVVGYRLLDSEAKTLLKEWLRVRLRLGTTGG